jgi:hypothetical protein
MFFASDEQNEKSKKKSRRTAPIEHREKVRVNSTTKWIIRKHECDGNGQVGRLVARCEARFVAARRVAVWLVAAAIGVSMPQLARAQVVLPVSPPAAPPWNSLQVFDTVPFAQYWARDPDAAVAPEDTPVKTRQQPGYESVGIRAGSWMFTPALTAGANYDSNVFASNTDKRSDIAATVEPSLAVSSLWDRHALDINGTVRSTVYRRFSQLDQTDVTLGARGRIDVWDNAAILTSFRLASLHEGVGSLTSPTGAVEPTPYSLASGDVSYWQQFNRLAISFGVRSDTYNYGSTRAQDGSIINQDSRDGRVDVGHGRLDYAISSNLGLFSAIEVNRRDLRGTPSQSLSSDGYRSLSGFNVRFGNLVTGEFGAGYAKQRFDDPTIGTVAGPAYRALLTWSPTRLLDFHFKAEQIVTEAADTVASGIRADALQLGADYELRRDTVLSLSGVYERDKFFGLVRDDNVYGATAELKHLFNRYSYISFQYRYLRRDSSIPTSSYDKHEVGLNVTAHY